MKNPKLIDGLRMLDKDEWISFRKYILMYCKKSSDNYQLLDHLFSVRNSLSDLKDIESIKKPLFDRMTSKSFSNLMSRVYIWFEEWLIWHENKKISLRQDVQLVRILNRKGNFNLADKVYNRLEKKLLTRKELDLETNKLLYELHHYHYFSDNRVKYRRKEEILETLVHYYNLQIKEQTLLYIAELYNWGGIQNHDYSTEIALLEPIVEMAANSKTSEVIQLIVALVRDMDPQALLLLKTIIESGQLVKNSELHILATLYMVTFSLRLWNNNKISDPKIVFEAYDFGLESGVLLNTGKIPFIRFMNLVTTLGFIKTSEKTYAFIDKWKHIVEGEEEGVIGSIGYALLKFFEQKYDEIIPLLVGIRCESDHGRLRSTSLELIGLYVDRKNNYSFLFNRIHNFKRVLKTYGSKQSNQTYRSMLNFATILELLAKRDFARIYINIDNYSPLLYKRWLEKEVKADQN